jgi:hypothetical protein
MVAPMSGTSLGVSIDPFTQKCAKFRLPIAIKAFCQCSKIYFFFTNDFFGYFPISQTAFTNCDINAP